MKEFACSILGNVPLTRDVMKLTLSGDFDSPPRPGQFVNVKIPGKYLRRPISVCDFENGVLTLIYKTVGEGTKALAGMKTGTLSVLGWLGNGYDLNDIPDAPCVAAGGVGTPPTFLLTKELIRLGRRPRVILGFNSAREAFYLGEFEALGTEVALATADGSAGKKGFVTDLMEEVGYVFACGPEPMLKAVWKKCAAGQFSFEERMACGFGVCMGCSRKTVDGYKRVCADGPVFRREEILWED